MQKRKKLKIITAFALTTALAIGIPCYAGTTQEEIDSVVAQNEETQANLVSVEERLAALEAQKGDTESYLSELTAQLNELSSNLTMLQAEYDAKQQEIAQVQLELEESRASEQAQYEDMKKRIQYIYEESSNAGLLEALFSAESFTDFLNRADAMSQINSFDRQMLESYAQIVSDIEAKEALLVEEQNSISELQNRMQEEQGAIETIYESSYRELEACLAEINSSENAQNELAAQIIAQEEMLDQLMTQKFLEEEAERIRLEEEAAAARAAAEAAQAEQEAQAAAMAAEYAETVYVQPEPEQNIYDNSYVPEAESGSSSSYQEPAPDISQNGNLTYLGNFTLTAYCSCSKCCGKWAAYAGTTASGAACQEGVTVAMGGVPFGTQLVINGHTYTVQDRGTPYGHVDIYFSTHAAACAFGLKHADVYQAN